MLEHCIEMCYCFVGTLSCNISVFSIVGLALTVLLGGHMKKCQYSLLLEAPFLTI